MDLNYAVCYVYEFCLEQNSRNVYLAATDFCLEHNSRNVCVCVYIYIYIYIHTSLYIFTNEWT